MGYTTKFDGKVTVEPPLNQDEITFLTKFSETRRMACVQGPYYVDRGGSFGQDHGPDVLDYNEPPKGQPGLWCHWVPTEDGTAIVWDGGEKFYDAVEWMQYIIDHFIGPKPLANPGAVRSTLPVCDIMLPFLTGHNLNGQFEAQGEERGDHWLLVVENNVASERRGRVVYDEPEDGPVIDGDYTDVTVQGALPSPRRLLR